MGVWEGRGQMEQNIFSVHGILRSRILECVAILFPGNFPSPGIEAGLLHCRQIPYHLSHQGNPTVQYSEK